MEYAVIPLLQDGLELLSLLPRRLDRFHFTALCAKRCLDLPEPGECLLQLLPEVYFRALAGPCSSTWNHVV